MPFDPNDKDTQDAIAKAVAEAKTKFDEDNQGLLKKNQELIEQNSTLKKKFSNVDLDEYTRMQTTEKERLEKEGNYEKLYKQSQEEHANQLAVRDKRTTNLERALHKSMVHEAALKAINTAGGNATVLMPHIEARMKVEEQENGEYLLKVLDDSRKNQLYNTKGTPASISDLVNTFKENDAFAPLFKPNGASGTGAQGSTRSGTSTLPFEVDKDGKYNVTELMKWWKTQDDKEAAKLQLKAAGVKLPGITN